MTRDCVQAHISKMDSVIIKWMMGGSSLFHSLQDWMLGVVFPLSVSLSLSLFSLCLSEFFQSFLIYLQPVFQCTLPIIRSTQTSHEGLPENSFVLFHPLLSLHEKTNPLSFNVHQSCMIHHPYTSNGDFLPTAWDQIHPKWCTRLIIMSVMDKALSVCVKERKKKRKCKVSKTQ